MLVADRSTDTKTILLCAVLAFAVRASGQTTTYSTGTGHAQPSIPTAQTSLPNALPPVTITSDYYAQPKVLVLHVLNNSGKDITGYTIIIRHKVDGTLEENGRSETTSDMLNALVISQMAKNPMASDRVRQEKAAFDAFPASTGTGLFMAGENRDMTLTGINNGSELDAVAGVVFYTDGSYEKSDEDAFKRLLTMRQSGLQQMKEQDEVIRNALADTNEHPVAVALTELNKRRAEAMDKPNQAGFFPMDLGGLRYLQQPGHGDQKGKTERERLTQYVEEQEKRVELMTPHCHLEISVQDK